MVHERIKHIATQAGLQPFEDCGPGYVAKMEKFAELIVKDCISVIDPNTGIKPFNQQTQEEFWKNQAIYLIKHHFKIIETELNNEP
jgi:hypothetical protein